jgi:hypothetical protein
MSVSRIPIISAMYFGPVELYRILAGSPKVIVDVGEHYERQSYRTRTSIIGPNGVQDLVVQIARRSGEKMPMHTVGLSYAETWPQQHLHAIRSAYGKTPWYIHFIDAIEDLLTTRHERLIDLSLASMRLCLGWLRLPTILEISEVHAEAIPGEHIDLRTVLHPKRALPTVLEPAPPYPQVFADRHGSRPRMCVLDLLCNCGPQARMHLLDRRGG